MGFGFGPRGEPGQAHFLVVEAAQLDGAARAARRQQPRVRLASGAAATAAAVSARLLLAREHDGGRARPAPQLACLGSGVGLGGEVRVGVRGEVGVGIRSEVRVGWGQG